MSKSRWKPTRCVRCGGSNLRTHRCFCLQTSAATRQSNWATATKSSSEVSLQHRTQQWKGQSEFYYTVLYWIRPVFPGPPQKSVLNMDACLRLLSTLKCCINTDWSNATLPVSSLPDFKWTAVCKRSHLSKVMLQEVQITATCHKSF